jgi:NAD(P)-dependent dehydrogenase (short-subunit alcohol dehydrogenase family)
MITQYKNVYAYFCDFSDENSVLSLLSNIPQMDLDVLVNNAYSGYTIGTHFDKTDSFDFLSSFNTNIMPTIRITQEVIKVFKKKRSGKIITILTDALMGPPPIGYSVYTATKAYLAQLVKVWSKEYIKFGITSNAISPSYMQTKLTKDINEFVVEQMLNEHPLKRLLTTEEVAFVVMNLLRTSNQMNGVNIPINAGEHIF